MSTTRTRRPTRTEVRRRLLDAAAEVLVTHGYGGASVEVITEAAGLSRGALYSNFADKDDLYLALLDDLETRQIEDLSALFAEQSGLEGFLRQLAHRPRAGGGDARAHMVLQVELWLLAMRNDHVRARLAEIQRRSHQAIVPAVVEAAGGLGLTAIEVAAVVTAISEGLLMQRLLDPDQVADTLLVDVLHGLARLTGLLPDGSDG